MSAKIDVDAFMDQIFSRIEFIRAPCREEEMDTSLNRRKDGSYFLLRFVDGPDREPQGCVELDVSPAKAAAWWVEHFVPAELRPFLKPNHDR